MHLASWLCGASIGFITGAFTPAVGRKIKSWFVTESKAVESKVTAEASAVAKKV